MLEKLEEGSIEAHDEMLKFKRDQISKWEIGK